MFQYFCHWQICLYSIPDILADSELAHSQVHIENRVTSNLPKLMCFIQRQTPRHVFRSECDHLEEEEESIIAPEIGFEVFGVQYK